ncbi:MAG: DUF192 domain-containing protein [Thermoplasmata archaeon]|nr:DUF192 domain-containing protein [Thermoplasmata archaeon]
MRDLKLTVIKVVIIIIILVLAVALMFIFYDADSPPEDGTQEPDYEALAIFQTSGNQTIEIKCEVASTPEERLIGLMGVAHLPEDEGMVFVFEETKTVEFWMKNVEIPLDIVFIDVNMTIINITEANVESNVTPESEMARYPSGGPVKYVVEFNRGICSSNGIMIGSQVNITFT